MRTFFTSLKALGLAAALGILGFGQAAEAANPLELNFWLSGPKYDGRVKQCEEALPTIISQFQEKESTFWNSFFRNSPLSTKTPVNRSPMAFATSVAATVESTPPLIAQIARPEPICSRMLITLRSMNEPIVQAP